MKRFVTYSELATFRDCQQEWFFRYGLGYRSVAGDGARINDGRVLHDTLEAHYRGRGQIYCLGVMAESLRKVADPDDWPYHEAHTLPQLSDVFFRYLAQYAENDFAAAWAQDTGEPMVEYEFMVPVYAPSGRPSTKYALAGKVDLIINVPEPGWWMTPEEFLEPGLWIVDHKTTRMTLSESDFAKLIIDQQMRTYAWALSVYLGQPIQGVIHNRISTKPFSEIKINKNGTVAATKVTCDVDHFISALEAQDRYLCDMTAEERKARKLACGIDWDKYATEIQRLSQVQFFARGCHRYTEDDMKEAQMELYQSALTMGQTIWYQKNTNACDHWSGCSYRALCRGQSPDDLYTVVDKQHTELELDLDRFHAPYGRPYVLTGEDLQSRRIVGMDDLLDSINA